MKYLEMFLLFGYKAQLEPSLSRFLYAGFILHPKGEDTPKAHWSLWLQDMKKVIKG